MTPDTPTPSRRTTPPDGKENAGLWVRRQHDRKQVEVYLFVPNNLAESGLSDVLVSHMRGTIEPRQIHWKGDIWEGPFPIPSLP